MILLSQALSSGSPSAKENTGGGLIRTSVTSTSSSGFEETLESPTSMSAMPLLGEQYGGSGSDQGFSESFSMMVS